MKQDFYAAILASSIVFSKARSQACQAWHNASEASSERRAASVLGRGSGSPPSSLFFVSVLCALGAGGLRPPSRHRGHAMAPTRGGNAGGIRPRDAPPGA